MSTSSWRPRTLLTATIAPSAQRRLAEATDLTVWPDEVAPSNERLIELLQGVEGIVSMVSDRLDAATIAAAPSLRAISNFAVGVDNIDLAAATARKIPVGHTPGVLTETVADLAFALLMAAARRITDGDRFVRAGRWKAWRPLLMLGRDIHGATLGIIGMGAIGRATARRATGFGMRLLYHNPTPRPGITEAEWTPLDDLLAQSDFVVISAPLTEATRHMIGARELALMKPGAFLINVARGPVVDQQALMTALRSGHLGGAGLDVMEVEPIAAGDPLLALPNVVVTPHIGSASVETRTRMSEMTVTNLLEGLAGRRPPHCANPLLFS